MATTVFLRLKNFTPSSACLTRLGANDGMEENTLISPTAIHPVEGIPSPASGGILVDIPPYSLNIIRMK